MWLSREIQEEMGTLWGTCLYHEEREKSRYHALSTFRRIFTRDFLVSLSGQEVAHSVELVDGVLDQNAELGVSLAHFGRKKETIPPTPTVVS